MERGGVLIIETQFPMELYRIFMMIYIIRAIKRLISIIIGKKILLCLQKWDLKFIVFLFHGVEFFQMVMKKKQMKMV